MEGNFLFQALIYLAAAVIFVPIAKRLGLGSVLGYLLAGIIIGPFVLEFIGQEGEDIMHFAEFGVVMMLFLVGLELEPALLWRLRTPILGLGGLQVLITTLTVGGIALALGRHWNEALAIGMTLAMSSTAIVLQTLSEKGLLRSSAGQSAFSVLLFQDIAVIPMLAIIPLLAIHEATGGSGDAHGTESLIAHLPAWLQTLAVLGAVIGVIVAGRYLVQPLMRIVARTRLRELFTATSLLLVVGIAVLMTLVGLSPALGTFLAGVVLANSEYKHEFESDLEPFKGLLLGLFFMAVGASIDFQLISEQPLAVAELVLSVILFKALILFILGRFFRMGLDQNVLFAVALSQVGEFAFVLLSFIRQEAILDEETIGLLMATVAISMALTPLIMLVNEKLMMPRLGTKERVQTREMDAIEEKNSVIIAGFGRFGSIVGRFLRANGIRATVLDIDSDRVDLLRKMGFKVYYGDASRYDLLQSAGAEDAQIIVIALESAEKNLELAHTVKKHFPHLHIMVRSFNYYDTYEFMDEGLFHIYRDTLDTSLRVGVDALKLLGKRAYQAERSAKKFRRHDEQALKSLAAVRDDQKEYIDTVRQRVEELEELMKSDLIEEDLMRDIGWDAESLRKEATEARQ